MKIGLKAVCVSFSLLFSSALMADSVSEGRDLFAQRCSSCHELPEPVSKSWVEWVNIMVAMSHMAQLDQEERSLILQYLLSYYIAKPVSDKK
ncbi:MAG: hypothetical protein ACRBCI_11760 [Cellvibrionaceae bacterium]